MEWREIYVKERSRWREREREVAKKKLLVENRICG